MVDTLRRLKEEKATIRTKPIPKAVVIIPLIKEEGEWHILFEKRSTNIDTQPGDVCFPGGHIEEGENRQTALLREIEEELFISSNQVSDLVDLGDITGPGDRAIGVFCGVISDYGFSFSKEEVEEVFSVPVSWLKEYTPKYFASKLVQEPDDDFPFEDIYGGKDYPFTIRDIQHIFYYYKDKVIWGFTARILQEFVKLLDSYT